VKISRRHKKDVALTNLGCFSLPVRAKYVQCTFPLIT
jgi:hypothetical protein